MGNIQDKIGEQPQPNGGGMRRMLDDGSQSMSELREFMSTLRGRSPQEVLGEVANSSLVQSTVVSAIGFLVVIIGLSVASHYWKQVFPGSDSSAVATKPDSGERGDTGDRSEKSGEPATNDSATAPDAGPAPAAGTSSGDPTLDTLGIGESKAADPKANPLENSLDNLLDGAK